MNNNENLEVMKQSEKSREIPREVKGWNWGAFFFNIYWGFGNKTYLPLFCLIPVFNIFWIFVCGMKGNEWAFKAGHYDTEELELFKQIQKTWNRAGLIAFILQAVILVAVVIIYLVLLSTTVSSLKNIG